MTSHTLTVPRWQAHLPGIVRTGAGDGCGEDSMSGKERSLLVLIKHEKARENKTK